MNINNIRQAASGVAGCLLTFCGCQHENATMGDVRMTGTNLQFVNDQGGISTPRMTLDQVLKIAKDAAKAKGYALDEYPNPRLEFTPQHKEHQWSVFFQHKSPAGPGTHFLVWVNDETGKAELMHGE